MEALKILSIIILFCRTASCQIDADERCSMYLLTANELMKNVRKYDTTFVVSQYTNKRNEKYFPIILKYSIRKQKLDELGIKAEMFLFISDNEKFDCELENVRCINSLKYYKKREKYSRKSIALCTFSNIGYYDNYAVIEVIVNLSYGRCYVNFYFFKKDTNWQLIESILELQ